ncbi:MAG: serine/threonine-protein kinase [Isosphaeraceae bacterium]
MARLDDFLTDLKKSRLVAWSDVEVALESVGPEENDEGALRLARALVERGSLTRYQARKILSGATKGFFLGGYRILCPLGEGGMGKVYLARREGGGDEVAIKVLPPRKAAEEAQSLERFKREMDLSRRVVHPNLARTLDVGEEDGVHFMIMEYIRGESLFELVRGERGAPLRLTDAARLFVKVLDGLEAAHDAGIVHRDLKPSNVMVTPEGDVRVLDLGLARAAGEEAPLTRPNIVVGTLDYVSPEQLVNASSADARSDLYSLGCTLYFTLAGRPPFDGGDLVNKIFKQRMDDPEPLERVAKGVPAEFAAIVRKLMAKKPDDRYQSAAELRDDLHRWTDPRRLVDAPILKGRPKRPLMVFDEDDDPKSLLDGLEPLSLRELGEAEAAPAPRARPRKSPLSAVSRPPPTRHSHRGAQDPSQWLTHLIALVIVLGLLVVLFLTLFG